MLNDIMLFTFSRNISMLESFSGVLLAVLVCVVAGLLLNIDFYKNFWVFNLCWVIGTAHFSLIKVMMTLQYE